MSGAATLLGCRPATEKARSQTTHAALPTCVVRPEQTEGPYFVDERLNRSDIRSEPGSTALIEGTPLELAFKVSSLGRDHCVPLAGAYVDLWHCDAMGMYSDVEDGQFNTVGKKFLRGYQVTNDAGIARFTTIYPGWYPGRTVHIHFKIRTGSSSQSRHEFTSQLYFDDALTDRVHAREPYARNGPRELRNNGDGIFRDGGRELILAPSEGRSGLQATFDVALQIA
jgi:protocatechuate 3,4-dioxygenase beta subunit